MLKFFLPRILLLLLILSSLTQCKSRQRATKDSGDILLRSKAEELFKDDFTIIENANGQYALVTKEVHAGPQQIFPTLYFFVWSHEDGEMVFRDILPQGKVNWTGIYEITCESIPGRVSEDEQRKRYTYNVQTSKNKQ